MEILKKRKYSFTITGLYILALLCTEIIFYPIIPIVLGYAPGSINTPFQKEVDSLTYIGQYISVLGIVLLLGVLYLLVKLRKIDMWETYLNDNSSEGQRELKKIRKLCLTLPYKFYIVMVFVPTILLILALTFENFAAGGLITTFKISCLIFTMFTFIASAGYIFTKRKFNSILIKTYKDEELEGIRINLSRQMLIQFLPVLAAAMLFTSLLGYSRLVKEKGDILFESYKNELENVFSGVNNISDKSQIQPLLDKVKLMSQNDSTFIIDTNGTVTTSNGLSLSDFFLKYSEELSDNYDGHVYDYYGIDSQGSVIKLNGSLGTWIVGIKYEISSPSTIYFFLASFIALLLLNIIVIYFFSREIRDNITSVANNLEEFALSGNLKGMKSIPATSNDEIGDLIHSFNTIRNRNFKNLLDDVSKVSDELENSSKKVLDSSQNYEEVAHKLVQINEGMAPQMFMHNKNIRGLSESISRANEEIEDVNLSINNLSENSGKMLMVAEVGGKLIGNVVEQIKKLEGTVTQAANTIDELNKVSLEIDSIIALIKDVAEQTNLLSLNASIEAARAGEHGKGFAVVAQEVRKLAEASKHSAGKVSEIIGGISQKLRIAGQISLEGRSEVNDCVSLANDTGKHFEEIINSVNVSANEIRNISSTVNNISGETNRISQSANQILSLTAQISESFEEVVGVSGDQSGITENLVELSQKLYKLAAELNSMSKANG